MYYLEEEESVWQNNQSVHVIYYAICYYEVFGKMLKKKLVWSMMLIKAEMRLWNGSIYCLPQKQCY